MDFKRRKIKYNKKNPILETSGIIIKGIFGFLFGWIFKKNDEKQRLLDVNHTTHRHYFGIFATIIIIFIIFFYGCSAIIQKIGLINVIGIFGEELDTDVYGNTNILLLGTGGGDHDGADLTDTIILASIDYDNNIIPMLSLPRDFYVDIEELDSWSRINQVYEMGNKKYDSETGIKLLEEAVEDITGVEIHYYVKIDFQGFKDIVESLGGVEVNVENAIHDPYYPLDGTIQYQTFDLAAGLQVLDGETALKYARSRKTTSDFDRSKRQQKLLFAIKETALSKDVLLNPGKITSLYNSVNSHFETNLSLRQIIELAKLSEGIGKENIITRVITDDPTSCGGFLYVPERALFGGAFVLVPIGNNYDFIHQYVDLIFHYPEVNTNEVQIQVLNGTKTPGLASEAMAVLDRLCLNVIRYGNAQSQDIETTTLYYKGAVQETPEGQEPAAPKAPEALGFINTLIPGKIDYHIPEKYFEDQYISDANIIIELGADYAENKPDDIFFRYYPSDTPATSTTEAASEAEAIPATTSEE
ncbi:LCP family protein [Patescibacteria group bacterium]|nr:LCP family protein [Patescibacteria group bacterium]